MGTKNEQLFTALQSEECPSYLCERICQALIRERERSARTRLVLSSLSGISSLVGLMFALPSLINAASETGFTSYSSLLMSDSDLVMSHVSSFGLSLLESLPGFEISLTLFLFAVLLVSIRNFILGLLTAHFQTRHASGIAAY